MKHILITLFSFLFLFACTDEPDTPPIEEPGDSLYFPSISGSTWTRISLDAAGYNSSNLPELLQFLEDKHTKGFIVLKKGRILIESYFNGHSQEAANKWASAGKTLTGTVVGIAQEEGFLDIQQASSSYLGAGWTSCTSAQESSIKVVHQLTMTSGLNDIAFACQDTSCLTYIADAGDRWAYHNAPYMLLQQVVSNATSQDFESYFNQKLKYPIGMSGYWFTFGDYEIYYSNTRSMARFGLLASNNFKWEDQSILGDETYKSAAITTSQSLNHSYGYLWWLNGQDSYMLPQTQTVFSGSMIPNAPSDMYMAMGKDDQRIYIVPNEELVVIRMGDQAYEGSLSLSEFDINLWEKLNAVINN